MENDCGKIKFVIHSDEVIFIDAIPETSIGKFAKRFLRDRFKEKRFA